MSRSLTLEEAKARPLEELLGEVADSQETIRIALNDAQEIEIKPILKLKPLITFEGRVPEGWKDAIYPHSK